MSVLAISGRTSSYVEPSSESQFSFWTSEPPRRLLIPCAISSSSNVSTAAVRSGAWPSAVAASSLVNRGIFASAPSSSPSSSSSRSASIGVAGAETSWRAR